jgi:hypothetical protein
MKIENQELAESCKGDPVTYVPRHANGNASHKDAEHGIITRWNDKFIFVEYGTGTPKATQPELLVWG